MTTLAVSSTFDYSATTLAGVDAIQFADVTKTIAASFSASQFDNIQISSSVAIVGGTGPNSLTVTGSQIDASNWTFSNWSSLRDKVVLNGTSQGDSIMGSTQSDTIDGGTGNDTLVGGDGQDRLLGGGDDDYLQGGNGADFLAGSNGSEAGNDTLFGGSDNDTINSSGAGADQIDGGDGVDWLILYRDTTSTSYLIDLRSGGGTSDIGDGTTIANIERISFVGGSGNDVVYCGAFNDDLRGGAGADLLSGGAGDDILIGGDGNDTIDGGIGNDSIYVYDVNDGDRIDGGTGSDFLYIDRTHAAANLTFMVASDSTIFNLGDGTVYSGIERVEFRGGLSNDTVVGGSLDDKAYGSQGNDVLIGNSGNDILSGGDGNDKLLAGSGDDTCDGGLGVDTISYEDVTSGISVDLRIYWAQNTGGAGIDMIYGCENLIGGTGNDTCVGNVYQNLLIGLDGADNLKGLGDDDTLQGGLGADTLVGGNGNDVLEGDAGKDVLSGSRGADVFKFVSITDSSPLLADRITDFVHGTDRIDVSAIDAVNGGVDDAFQFIGGSQFSDAGQLRVWSAATTTIIEGDYNGDRIADFRIVLKGIIAVDASDFVL